MKEFRIFVASSFELAADRVAIGNIIRELSDQYQAQENIRIRMLCWEDYDPSYNGLPSQQRYDEDLIKQSHMMIVLFKTKCGKYTQGEIRLGNQMKLPIVYLHRKGFTNTEDLNDYLANTIQPLRPYESLEDLETFIKEIIKSHVKILACKTSNIITSFLPICANIISNESFDLDNLQNFVTNESFGNSIRQLNEVAYSLDLPIIQWTSIDKIADAENYIVLLRNIIDKENIIQIEKAIKNIAVKDTNLQRLMIFFYANDSLEESDDVKEFKLTLINQWKYFPSEYKHIDTIRMYLFRYMINQSFNDFSDLNIKGTTLYYKGFSISDISNLDFLDNLSHDLKKLCDEFHKQDLDGNKSILLNKNKIQEDILKLVTLNLLSWLQDNNLIIDKLNKENSILSEFEHKKRFSEIINRTTLNDVDDTIKKYNSLKGLLQQTEEEILQKIRNIEFRINALKNNKYSNKNTQKIVSCFDAIVSLLKPLYKESDKYRRLLFIKCMTLCKYAENGIVVYDYDNYYELILTILEEDENLMNEFSYFQYIAMEANLLNGYSYNKKWDKGDMLAKKIFDQISKKNNETVSCLELEIYVHAFQAISTYYGEKGEISTSIDYLTKAIYHQNLLSKSNPRQYLHSTLSMLINNIINYLKMQYLDKVLTVIKQAESVIADVEKNKYKTDNFWIEEKVSFYSKMAIVFYDYQIFKDLNKAEEYFSKAFNCVSCIETLSYSKFLSISSELYHNHAFMLSKYLFFFNNSNIGTIINEYKKAIEYRRLLSKYNKNNEPLLAESLLNLGDIYRQIKSFSEGKKLAIESKAIYQRFENNSIILTTENVCRAKLLLATVSRDYALENNDTKELKTSCNQIFDIYKWAVSHKHKMIYFSIIESEYNISKKILGIS